MTEDEIALPSNPLGLRKAAVAATENVRDAWVALHMIREALEAKRPVRQADGLGFNNEAEVLVEAILKLR